MTTIDTWLTFLNHPFFAVVMGIVFWFTLVWSIGRDERKTKGLIFWGDQKDEVVVAIIGGLLFLVWDDEIMQGLYDKGIVDTLEIKTYYYLIVAPFIDRVYWLFKKKGK